MPQSLVSELSERDLPPPPPHSQAVRSVEYVRVCVFVNEEEVYSTSRYSNDNFGSFRLGIEISFYSLEVSCITVRDTQHSGE